MRHLPQLDIRTWRREPRRFAEQLRAACHHFGFFTLRHDLPSGLAERQLREAARFFSLPRHEKLAVDYGGSAAFRGYMSVGVENTAGRPDVREQLEIAVEGAPAPADAWPPYERLRGPNQWPAAQPGLRPVVEDYVRELSRISAEVTRALCAALGLEGDEALRPWFDEPHWQLKIASYPPAPADEAEADGASPRLGVGAHTDSGFLTLLLQDGVGGLQAFSRGEWIDVPPAGPDVLVCNLGELTELVTRGYLLATPHRVVCRPSGGAPRISVPFFYNPSLRATVSALELPAGLPWERDEGYDAHTHWRRERNAMLSEYGANAFKSLARSHPAVFARHHADLRVLDDGRVVRAGD